jgi:hypothetical protein
MPVFVSEHATEEVPIFPEKKWSKRRRRRVVGKYGSWTRRAPCAFRAGPALYVHPTIYAEMQRQFYANSGSL